MKGMPLPFDFQGKGVLDLELVENSKSFFTDFGGGGVGGGAAAVSSFFFKKYCFLNGGFGEPEPTSVLDSARTPSRPTSSSTLSSSLGGGGGSTAGGGGAASTDTACVAAAVSDTKWQQQDSTTATSSNAGRPDSGLLSVPPPLQIGTATAACGGANPEKFAMEDWESVLSESVAVSPSQEQSILRLIMGDVEDPAMGSSLNKVLQIGGAAASEFEFSDGFGVVDQGFCGGGGGDQFGSSFMPALPSFPNNNSNHRSSNLPTTNFKFSPNETLPLHHHHHHHQTQFDSPPEMKPPIFNPNLLLNHHSQNPSFFFPLSYPHQDNNNTIFAAPPHPKRHNSGSGGSPLAGAITDTGQQELFMSQQHMQHQTHQLPHQLQLLPNLYQQKPKTTDCGGGGGAAVVDELGQQQAVVDQLYKAAELVQTGNLVLAQGILARLNHHLSPIGKPFHRAAFYFKESLQLLLHQNNNNSSSSSSPFALVFKIGAYKSFSEISPLVQFSNFTCNQAILENLEGSNRIHIVDFDIGYGGQWASLMQELALRGGGGGGPPSLKITAFASHLTPHDQLELSLTQENLIQFASEINISFEFEVVSIDSLNSGSWARSNDNEAVAVNLPVGFLANCQMWVPLILRFVKHLSPRIVVSVDRGCDRTDLPFANHVIHALQSYSNMLESLDAVNVNIDALQKIERFLIHPGIEKIVTGRFGSQEKTQHWRALFLSSGFSPVAFSNFAESQAECVVKRTPVRGFQVEKRQSALVLCWQRKELVSASAWRC